MARHDPHGKEDLGERFSQFASVCGITDGHDLRSANDRVSDGVERDLLQKLKLLGGYFSDSGIQTEILEQQDIVRLCNLVNNPAYVHLEDSGINAAIPILESVGVA